MEVSSQSDFKTGRRAQLSLNGVEVGMSVVGLGFNFKKIARYLENSEHSWDI